MKGRVSFLMIFLISLVAASCTGRDWDVLEKNGSLIVIPKKCEKSIVYGGKTWGVEAIKLPIQVGSVSLPVEVGKFYTDYKLLQQATQVAEVLDSRRVENCRLLQVSVGMDAATRKEIINDIRRDSERLYHLALLVVLPCEPCVKDWVSAYRPLAEAIKPADRKAAFRLPPDREVVVPFEALLR